MRCAGCDGTGWRKIGDFWPFGEMYDTRPCLECNGSGVGYCCDGLPTQSEDRYAGDNPVYSVPSPCREAKD